MKKLLSLFLFAISLTSSAVDFYKVEKIFGDGMYIKKGDVVLCLDHNKEHPDIALRCFNTKVFNETKFNINEKGELVLSNSKKKIEKVVGFVNNEVGAYLLDETHDSGKLTKITTTDLKINAILRRGFEFNTNFGNCSEMNCDFSIFSKRHKLYFEVLSSDVKIEKVKVY